MRRAILALGGVLVCVAAEAAPDARSLAATRGESPAPSDVRVEMKQGESGRWNVTLRRAGYLVALRAAERTSAARDLVAAEIESAPGSETELGWETTDRSTLETTRGGIRIVAAADGPKVSWFSQPAPVAVASSKDRLHDCRAFENESSGFSVVCRVARVARKLAALNLTGESPLAGVATDEENGHFVRLDLPVAEGGVEARLLGYLDGNTAVVVRAEATWARGEARPTLSLADGTRRQLTAPTLRSWLEFDVRF